MPYKYFTRAIQSISFHSTAASVLSLLLLLYWCCYYGCCHCCCYCSYALDTFFSFYIAWCHTFHWIVDVSLLFALNCLQDIYKSDWILFLLSILKRKIFVFMVFCVCVCGFSLLSTSIPLFNGALIIYGAY